MPRIKHRYMERDIDDELVRTLLSRQPSLERVRKVVAAGANVNARQSAALSCQCRLCLWSKAQQRKDKCDLVVPRDTILMLALENPSIPTAVLTFLIESGANPLAVNATGETVLMQAMGKAAKPATIELLLSHGIDVNATDDRGQTALMRGLRYSYDLCEASILALIERGADVNARDGSGWSVMQYALTDSRAPLRLIHYLEQHGAVMDYWDPLSLLEVAMFGSPEAVTFMLSNGADARACVFANTTVLDMVASAARDSLSKHYRNRTRQRLRTERIDRLSRTFKILAQAGAKRMSER